MTLHENPTRPDPSRRDPSRRDPSGRDTSGRDPASRRARHVSRPSLSEWPGLADVPTGPRATVAARIARRLFLGAVGRLPVTVVIAQTTGAEDATGGPAADVVGRGGPMMVVHRPDEFFARVGRDGLIGFGEAYLTGAWDAPDLAEFLTVLAAELPRLIPTPLQRLRSAYVRRPPRVERNTMANTADNIAHHYDLSNELFELFLDPTLSYSSALFAGDLLPGTDRTGPLLEAIPPPATDSPDEPATTRSGDPAEPLDAAQARKIERLLDVTGVTHGTRLLEIGTGCGDLAIRAARRGATVHTVTLSAEQRALARDRVAAAGVADRVRVELSDYRDVRPPAGGFDAICSVEMIEAVGHDYWPTYFRALDRLLGRGGRAGLQAITMPHDRMLATRRTWTWMNKYIFPGGFLPSVQAMDEVTRAHTTLRIADRLSFGSHYAETLRRWDRTFLAAADRVRTLGFDHTFVRMWHFYLSYSRAGFASGYLDVSQLVLARPGEVR